MPCPIKGQLEFDFVSGHRPSLDDLYKLGPIPDSKFLKLLNNCCLVLPVDNDKHIRWLNEVQKKCADNMRSPNGNEAYHARSSPAGEQVFVAMERFYNNLDQRAELYRIGVSSAEVAFDHMDMIQSLKALSNQAKLAGSDSESSDSDDEKVKKKKKKVHGKLSISSKPASRSSIMIKPPALIQGRAAGGRLSILVKRDNAAQKKPGILFAVGLVPGGVENNNDYKNSYALAKDDSEVGEPHTGKRGAVRVVNSLGGNLIINTSGSGPAHITKYSTDAHSRKGSVVKDIAAKQLAKRINFKKLLLHPAVSAEAKANRIIDALEESIMKVYITSRQLALIILLFPQGKIWRAENFGTYRVELIITVLHRIVDMHNFDVVLHYLTTDEIACVYCRLGWLNIYNPMKPEV